MPNKLVIFPTAKLAEAEAYVAACDAHFAENYEPPNGIFGYCRPDLFGQHVTPLYGPPWEFNTGDGFVEPPECAALRTDGVVVDQAIWE